MIKVSIAWQKKGLAKTWNLHFLQNSNMHKNENMQGSHAYFWSGEKACLSTISNWEMPKNGVMHGVIHTVHKKTGFK